MHTPPRHLYDTLSILPKDTNRFHLTFRVRTCANAHVALLPEGGISYGGYEIVLGSFDNTHCEIRRAWVPVDSKEFYGVLSADAYHSFWVDWQQGNITAGFGNHGEMHLLAFFDPIPFDIYRATISTWNTCDGDWEIDQHGG